MTLATFLILLLATLVAPALAQEDKPTYAERLGWPKGARVLIFHEDDAGMAHGQNLGAIQALEYGVLTSVSTMMPCSWVPEFAAYLKQHPEVDSGLHLTLTSEWQNYRWGPVAGKPSVPGLVDPDGCLWKTVASVATHASTSEIEQEIRAQIERAETLGIPITHLDTHMGAVFARPSFLDAYIKVGLEKQIPVMLMGGHQQFIGADEGDVLRRLKVTERAEKVWQGGLPVLDDLLNRVYRWKSFDEKKKNLMDTLRTMKPGVTMVLMHCAVPDEDWAVFTDSSETRWNDTRVMTDPEFKKFIQDEKFILTTWREMMERRKKVK